MFAPDRDKIFADIDVNNTCLMEGCMLYQPETNKCYAGDHASCMRVNKIAAEIKSFMADNDDVFMYIKNV